MRRLRSYAPLAWSRCCDSSGSIAAELLEPIFDPFFTTKAPGKGTGLGLSTAQAIVKDRGGQILVSSEAGRGTRFRIYLPTPRVAAIRRITQLSLEAFGDRVLAAANGAEAIALYEQRRGEIAVVITDMMMPVLGGEGQIRALVQLNPSVRIIAGSGINSNEALARAARPNVARFLTKPFTAATVTAALHDVLSATSA